jgi:hypothetical protein
VIGFALRLTLRGGRESAARLVIIAAAVGLGVGLLLTTFAGINAVNSQNARLAWLSSGSVPGGAASATAAPLWWRLSGDEFQGRIIARVDVAATGPTSPVPPGIAHLPAEGQFYASPALARLLRSVPADQLGQRYPGREIGTIGPAGLPSPNSLVIVIGGTPAQVSQLPGAGEVTRISTTSPSSCNGPNCSAIGIHSSGIDLILSVVAAALLLPILIFIGTATRLSAARREQRYAAMRLVGATPRQVAVIAAVESTVAAVVGVATGFGLFYALRPVLAPIPFTGAPFFLHDVSLNLVDVLVVMIGVPLAAAAVSRLALRRTIVSPLGVTRRVTPPPPRAWRLVPLFVGLAELGWFAAAGRPSSTPGQIQAFLPGILITMVGLVIAGPWLTMAGSRLMRNRAARPATLIASRRLSDNPQAGFRSVSGLALALFAVTVGYAVITTINANGGGLTAQNSADRSTLITRLADPSATSPANLPSSLPPGVEAQLHAIRGVGAITEIHQAPTIRGPVRQGPGGGPVLLSGDGVVSCAQVAATPALGRCSAGAVTASIEPYGIGSKFESSILPRTNISIQQLQTLPVITVAVATDGSRATIEAARTALQLADPSLDQAPVTVAEDNAQTDSAARAAGYQRLADVVILASLPIAGCTLAVGIVAGLNDRKRPFSLLRLTGAPLRTLRHVVTLESVAPLVATSLLAIGTGFLAAYLFLRSQLNETLQAPGADYFGLVVAGLALALLLMASTLPVLGRVTGPETARNE